MDGMLDSAVGGSESPAATVEVAAAPDRSMQVLEYLVAVVAMIAAVALAFLR